MRPSFESWEMLVSIVDDQCWGHEEEILTFLFSQCPDGSLLGEAVLTAEKDEINPDGTELCVMLTTLY